MPPQAVTADTLLADALMADEDLYARFTAYSPVFRRFARVLLREDTANRLRLADVANMVGVPASDLVAIAHGAEAPPPQPAADPVDPPTRPAWLEGMDGGPQHMYRLDVRPMLESGHEPLPDILRTTDRLVPGEILALDATFHPVPLRRLLGSYGYASYAESLSPDHWRVFFRREAVPGCACDHGER